MRGMRVVLALVWLVGCGANEVVVEVRGGDGDLVRLDAKDLEYNGNHLVQAGSYTYPKMKRG
ncbi:MAG: hypothetical protein ABIL09_29125, partial [Gemmatimonadota bacterium]